MFEFTYKNHHYQLQAAAGLLIIQKDAQPRRAYKCVSDYEYTYKIQKTQLKAQGGAAGFLQHCRQCVENNFAVECWVIDPLEKILDYTREATQ